VKISQKLIIAFTYIVLLTALLGYISVNTGQKALREAVGQSSVILVRETLDKIDRGIYYRIERWESYIFANPILSEVIAESNQEFERLDNTQNYINGKDREWTAAPKETITPFMRELINNKLSQNIKRKADSYKKGDGYEVFPEVFATNKYGANVAQTQKTSDYYQADEEWWQMAKRDGLYIGDVAYDKSADVYSTDVGIRIDDKSGNFIGVMKVVLNIEDMISIIREVEEASIYETTQFKLLTENGKVIYPIEGEFSEKPPDKLLSQLKESKCGGYFITEGNRPGEGQGLFVHAHSKGYKDYKGLGWILVLEHAIDEILVPAAELRNYILIISIAVAASAALMGLYISKSISKPLSKLRDATAEISKRNLKAANQQLEAGQQQLKAANQQLESEITERKRAQEDLGKTHNKLLEASRRAGMAEVATGVLHNIGNVLNSVNVATQSIKKRLVNMKVDNLAKAMELLEEHADNLDTFLTADERGRKLCIYLNQLSEGLVEEQKELIESTDTLNERVQSIAEIINVQQSYAKSGGVTEIVSVRDVVEDAVSVNLAGLDRHGADLEREYEYLPTLLLDRQKLLQIIINIISNAKYSLQTANQRDKLITIRIKRKGQECFQIEVSDNGVGITAEDLTHIFRHGFTTRKEGHGFGLHSAALAAKEMGGQLHAYSDGPGKGATFVLELPLKTNLERVAIK